MRLSFVIMAVALASCASSPPPPQASLPRADRELTADELFARGRYAAAVDAYRNEVKRGERVAEMRAMALVAQLAQRAPGSSLVADLRSVEREFPSSRWGRIAGIIASEIDRGTVLRQAVMAAGADLRAANASVTELEARVAALTAQASDQQALVASLKEERTRLQAQIKDADERATAKDTRIHELEAELLALKQIDMERSP
jgi:chromosome segregation ATPase